MTLIRVYNVCGLLLSGVALGNTTYNIFLMSVMCGFCSLLSTYGPQVYGNPATSKHLGTVVQKVFLITCTMYLVVLGPYLRSLRVIGWLVGWVGQQAAFLYVSGNSSTVISENTAYSENSTVSSAVYLLADTFIQRTWSWGLLDFSMRLLTKYLSLQYLSTPVYISTGALLLLHVLLSYLFTVYWGLGLDGLILAGTLSRTLSLLGLVLYCCAARDKLAWAGFSARILCAWKEMLLLGLSASVNVFSEMGMYELAIFLAQFRGVDYLSTVVIAFQIITLIYSTTYGVCYASAALIGSALGSGDVAGVRRYIKLCLGNTLVESVVLALLGYLFRRELVSLFTADEQVITETTSILWVLLLEVPLDHLQTFCSYGVLVTVGRQVFVATALSIICYGVCTPVIVALIFFSPLGGLGVLLGMLLFVGLSCLVCGGKVLSLDLRREVAAAKDRINESCCVEEEGEEKVGLMSDTDESFLLEGECCAPASGGTPSTGIFRQNILKIVIIGTLLATWTIIGFVQITVGL